MTRPSYGNLRSTSFISCRSPSTFYQIRGNTFPLAYEPRGINKKSLSYINSRFLIPFSFTNVYLIMIN